MVFEAAPNRKQTIRIISHSVLFAMTFDIILMDEITGFVAMQFKQLFDSLHCFVISRIVVGSQIGALEAFYHDAQRFTQIGEELWWATLL